MRARVCSVYTSLAHALSRFLPHKHTTHTHNTHRRTAVGAHADGVDDGRLKVDVDGAGHVLARGGLGEEGVELCVCGCVGVCVLVIVNVCVCIRCARARASSMCAINNTHPTRPDVGHSRQRR